MRTLESTFANSLQNEVTTLCHCWQIKRRDGAVLGFTDFDRDLVFGGVTYLASASFNRTNIADDAAINAPSNLELTSIFDDDVISELDLIKGKYDYAEISVFLVNYLDLPSSITANPAELIYLQRGRLGQLRNNGRGFTAEARGLGDLLNQSSGNIVSRTCRYKLGDSRCTVDLTDFTHLCTVASVTSKQVFTLTSPAPATNDYGDQGEVIFTSGDNSGVSAQILDYSSARRVTLWEPLPFLPEVGDNVTLIAGCDKYFTTCRDKFENHNNFGGEHGDGNYLPGLDEMATGRK